MYVNKITHLVVMFGLLLVGLVTHYIVSLHIHMHITICNFNYLLFACMYFISAWPEDSATGFCNSLQNEKWSVQNFIWNLFNYLLHNKIYVV